MIYRARHAWTRLALAVFASISLTAAAPAAGTFRYVKSTGDDANPCTFARPCRTLQHGIDKTAAGGELRVLDSSSYGVSATIDKSITISADHVTIGATALDIVGGVVSLRGLDLNGAGAASGTSGISVRLDSTTVHIEGCTIHGFPGNGIMLNGAEASLSVADSIVRDNGQHGLYVLNTLKARLAVDNSRFVDNGFNGLAVAGIKATVSRSVVSDNAGSGFVINDGVRMNVTSTISAHNEIDGYLVIGSGQLTLESAVVRGNGANGLSVGGSGAARISNSVFTNNNIGIFNGGGSVLTRQNNMVSGNTNNISGTLTPLGGV